MKNKNNVKNRILFLSAPVASGIDKECQMTNDFTAVKSLGQGGFGKVVLCKHNVTGKEYAIKLIEKNVIRKQKMEDQLNREVKIMYHLDHKNIIKLYNHFEDDDYIYLIEEYVPGVELYKKLMKMPSKKFEAKEPIKTNSKRWRNELLMSITDNK